MASAALGTQVAAAALEPVGSDGFLKGSSRKSNNCLNFRSKPWVGKSLAWEKTQQSRHLNKVFCMSVQQASKSKVAVKPVELENANEPPLNLYKPKEPYTATIVSVERLVGPKAPGETCHIVIDHGGNVPYWEGQSYGVIPPGARSLAILVIWTLWGERNRRIFDDQVKSASGIVEEIKEAAKLWMSAGAKHLAALVDLFLARGESEETWISKYC